jgi:hypothetical protein
MALPALLQRRDEGARVGVRLAAHVAAAITVAYRRQRAVVVSHAHGGARTEAREQPRRRDLGRCRVLLNIAVPGCRAIACAEDEEGDGDDPAHAAHSSTMPQSARAVHASLRAPKTTRSFLRYPSKGTGGWLRAVKTNTFPSSNR